MPKPVEPELPAALHYIGDGRFIPGVPARDLTSDEVRMHWSVVRDSDIYQPEAASASAATEKADTEKE